MVCFFFFYLQVIITWALSKTTVHWGSLGEEEEEEEEEAISGAIYTGSSWPQKWY